MNMTPFWENDAGKAGECVGGGARIYECKNDECSLVIAHEKKESPELCSTTLQLQVWLLR